MSGSRPSIGGLRVMVAEDDGMIAEAICNRLTDAGCDVVATAENGATAIDVALSARPDIILMDVRLKGDMDGIRASELINEKVRIPVVYLTGDSDRATLDRAKTASAYGYVLKPFHIKNLVVAIEVAMERFETERRLEESQLTYASILGSIGEAVIAVDVAGRIRFMNEVAERLTGWASREARSEPMHSVLDLKDSGASALDLFARVLNSRSAFLLGGDAHVISRDGTRVSVDGRLSCVIDSLSRAVGVSITLRDVTGTRKAESDLKTTSQQLRVVIDTAADAVLMLDEVGGIVMHNAACERLFGFRSAEMVGRNIDTIMPSPLPDSRDGGAAPISVSARATICQRRDRTKFPAEVSVGEAGHATERRFVCVVHDVSERRALEASLLDAVGREQRRFASDLHDGLGQELTGLTLLLAALAKTPPGAQPIRREDLVRAGEIAQQALRSCQSIARGLSPIGSSDGNLVAALRNLVSQLKAASGPSISLLVREVSRLDLLPEVTDHLYRIAQEALTNALKHAQAKSIHVSLDINPAQVRLEVCDDGRGVKRSAIRGLGLRTMQYRASLIGARFAISPFTPSGTCVLCECPQASDDDRQPEVAIQH